MGFEKFTKAGRSFAPKVSIWSRGQFGFSKGAVKRFNLDGFGFVIFYYDKDTKRIGLEFTNDKDQEGALKLNKRDTGVIVGAKSFLDYYNINYKETKQYDLQHSEEDKLHIIDLQKAEESTEDENEE